MPTKPTAGRPRDDPWARWDTKATPHQTKCTKQQTLAPGSTATQPDLATERGAGTPAMPTLKSKGRRSPAARCQGLAHRLRRPASLPSPAPSPFTGPLRRPNARAHPFLLLPSRGAKRGFQCHWLHPQPLLGAHTVKSRSPSPLESMPTVNVTEPCDP